MVNVMEETYERLMPAWIVIHGEFIEYACERHAREFAVENGIPETPYGYSVELDGYGTVSDIYPLPSWDGGETDYPVSCACGQYLGVSLTSGGVEYMQGQDFPAWLYGAHGVKSGGKS